MGNTEVIFCRGSLWLCRILIVTWRKVKGKKEWPYRWGRQVEQITQSGINLAWLATTWEPPWWESQVLVRIPGLYSVNWSVLYWLNSYLSSIWCTQLKATHFLIPLDTLCEIVVMRESVVYWYLWSLRQEKQGLNYIF